MTMPTSSQTPTSHATMWFRVLMSALIAGVLAGLASAGAGLVGTASGVQSVWTAGRIAETQPAAVQTAADLLNDLTARSAAFRDGFLGKYDGQFVSMPDGSKPSYSPADAAVLTRTCVRKSSLFGFTLQEDAPFDGPCAAVRFDDLNGRAFIVYVVSNGTTWSASSQPMLNEYAGVGPVVRGVRAFWPAATATASSVDVTTSEIETAAEQANGLLRFWQVIGGIVAAMACGLSASWIADSRRERMARRVKKTDDADTEAQTAS